MQSTRKILRSLARREGRICYPVMVSDGGDQALRQSPKLSMMTRKKSVESETWWAQEKSRTEVWVE